jgi:hypothetical protein
MAGKKQKDSNPSWSHKNDFPIEEVWNTEHTLAQLTVPRLQAFKALDKHGGPSDFMDIREWNNAIQKMVDAFELMKYAGASHTEDEERTIKQGLDLFCKYFRHLWD